MDIHDIQALYGRLPQAGALVKYLEDASVKSVFLKDIVGSALPTLFAGIAPRLDNTFLFRARTAVSLPTTTSIISLPAIGVR